MEQVKVGDTVKLKSGGPLMTISSAMGGGNTFKCLWFAGAELREGIFGGEALVKEAPKRES